MFIDQQDILDTTSGGLDIIYYYYPQAKEAQGKADKRFKIRDERTPSASLKQLSDGVWVVTDFGGDQVPRNGIQVCQKEENLTFREAIVVLADRYGIGGIQSERNKPDFEKRPAKPEEQEGEYYFDLKKELTENELQVLGPKVTQEVCNRYFVYSCNSITYIKNREALITKSTENYPIFIVDHGDWKKIYEPLNPEKQYRFKHSGNKPKDYVNGLEQLNKAYEKYRDQQMNEPSEEDDDKPKDIKKLSEAILCSGERDALNVAGYGYYPVWLNSETAELSPKAYKEITRCVDTLYNLPDIDETGKRAAIKLGMKYLDVHHIWLPETLSNYKDNRGRPRKDFLDYIQLYPKDYDFKKLINVAKPLRFWKVEISKQQGTRYNMVTANTRFFLQSNGFYQIENKNSKTGQMFVHVTGNVVREIQPKDIKAYLIDFCEKQYLNNEVLELVLNTNRLSDATLQGLRQIDIDFSNCDHDSQYLFFKNKIWKITKDEIYEYRPGEVDRFVWTETVVDHNVKKLDDFFKITQDKEGNYDIEILKAPSKFFCYLINASRVHWRKELEERFEKMTEEEQEKYRHENKFVIDGKNLMPDEIYEQKQHLINKIFSIGYLLHQYKNPSKPWAIYAMDNILGEEGESNGRSGKSFCYTALRFFMKSTVIQGRNRKVTENPHIYDRVTEHTKYIIVDDAHYYLDYDFFFDSITGSLIVNPKNNQSYEIPFDKSPKFCFTSNHALRNQSASLSARILYAVFSDYYHEKTESNGYRELRKISDDFGKELFKYNYTEEEWNADFNFFAQCIKFYLSVPGSQKVSPPMGNVNLRNLLAEMGQAFKDWADAYFAIDPDTKAGDNVNRLIPKDEALGNFKLKTNTTGWTTNKFTKCLIAYCRFYDYTYNPKAFQNSQGRISKKVEGETKDMIYIQTIHEELNPADLSDDSGFDPKNKEDLPF